MGFLRVTRCRGGAHRPLAPLALFGSCLLLTAGCTAGSTVGGSATSGPSRGFRRRRDGRGHDVDH
jgi:hypothetical protein